MSEDLRTIPPEWLVEKTSDDDLSPYSIETKILRPGERRFLQIRECFLILCDNYPTRAAVLECARFEMELRFRKGPQSDEDDMVWRAEQHRLLVGSNPEDADLWGPFPSARLIERLRGLSTNAQSLGRTIAWLVEQDYIFVRKARRPRNGREVLLNVKQIERDLHDHPYYRDAEFKGSVKGSPEQFLDEPKDQVFAPLYEGLSDVVLRATAASKPDATSARAAMLLQRMLVRAETRERAGEEIPAPWHRGTTIETFGWGSKDTWMKAYSKLKDSQLILEVGKDYNVPLVVPNLPRILSLSGAKPPVEATHSLEVTIESPRIDDQVTRNRQSSNPDQTIEAGRPDDQGSVSPLSTEVFSESLTEYLAELKAVGNFDPSKVLEDHSDHIFEVRRKTQFVGLPFENGWENLTFSRLAQTDGELAAAALLLAQKLGRGERSAIAFPRATRKARAIIAVILGYWIDDHVTGTTPAEWITIDGTWFDMYNADFKKPEEQPLANARREMDRRLEATNNALIIENIAGSRQHAQIITKLKSAITGRADNLMPVIYVGLPDSVSDLSPKLDDGGLTPIVVRSLTERHKRFEVPDPPVPVEITDEALGDDPFGEP